jgi:hypothetical protein
MLRSVYLVDCAHMCVRACVMCVLSIKKMLVTLLGGNYLRKNDLVIDCKQFLFTNREVIQFQKKRTLFL